MRSVVAYVQSRGLPSGVDDLWSDDETVLDDESFVAAGQALTWQSIFICGDHTAIPLTRTSAVVVSHGEGTGPERWHDRFTLGLVHRMKGELAVAAVTSGLLREAAREETGEEAELLGSAIDGFTTLLTEVEDARRGDGTADRMVADTLRTHTRLLGKMIDQRVWARRRGEFTVHSVRSVSAGTTRPELEDARARIGLPWPTRVEHGVGHDLGLARWRTTMQACGHQMWCRVEGENALVTELWLRNPQDARE